ncbi:MAG TPA: HPr family phosphocarrier protein [Candidatus Egerieimonas intestinavium]|uniref:HPr family phosphocarrier protein n=1 Tax=Candidatus Egerieimonas intestinavium TaxID=2840777 RepID=A0A9D1EKQ9_9FIRM|nr:HPr family phosphocarrier protein [Candidatus Egerieimonas intestinavium]
MKRISIHLKDMAEIKRFVNLVAMQDFEIDLISGRYLTDAKSIMGVLSMDLNQPIDMLVHSERCEEFLEAIKDYIL